MQRKLLIVALLLVAIAITFWVIMAVTYSKQIGWSFIVGFTLWDVLIILPILAILVFIGLLKK
jgi:hypothetical protein